MTAANRRWEFVTGSRSFAACGPAICTHHQNELAKPIGMASPGTAATSAPSLPIPSLLQILVDCVSELQQQQIFELLQQKGYSCRVLTL
jgi:hypothetical protein